MAVIKYYLGFCVIECVTVTVGDVTHIKPRRLISTTFTIHIDASFVIIIHYFRIEYRFSESSLLSILWHYVLDKHVYQPV